MPSCAICFETFGEDGTSQATMPCCGNEGSSMKFCVRCIEVICQQRSSGVGVCPICKAFIQVTADQSVIISEEKRRCGMCCQKKSASCFNSREGSICSICELGRQNPARYECDRCHQVQRIPHPMYRYQPTPTEFGGATWACHQRCGDYTHWRIIPEDISRVPVDDTPEGWGGRVHGQDFESIREIRRN
mmetsp:Transcript_24001/g.31877  ORF Transcript_24001/g.31877 Transcript_24001/m.31877 type:complete len:189 (+) Transcript_24001:117-683(+)